MANDIGPSCKKRVSVSVSVSVSQGAPKGRQQKGDTGPGTHIFADFCRFSLIFGSLCKLRDLGVAQICAENRRKPQIFAGNRRCWQKPVSPICCLPFGAVQSLSLSLSLYLALESVVCCYPAATTVVFHYPYRFLPLFQERKNQPKEEVLIGSPLPERLLKKSEKSLPGPPAPGPPESLEKVSKKSFGTFSGLFPDSPDFFETFSRLGGSRGRRPLVAPYCAIPRDYLSDTPLLRAMGFLASQHGQLGAIPPPPF